MSRPIGFLYLISYAVLISLISVFTRQISGLDMQTIAFFRAILATGFILIVVVIKKEWQVFRLRYVGRTLIVSVAYCAMTVLFIGAFMHTTVANAIFLTYIAPCISVVYSKLFLKEAIPTKSLYNLIFSVAGLFLIAGFSSFSIESNLFLGNMMALGAGVTYAILMIASKSLTKLVPNSYIAFWQQFFSFLLLLPLATVSSASQIIINITPLLGLGILCTGLAYLFFNQGMRYLATSQALIITSLEPVLAIGVAAVFLNEVPSLWAILGILFVLFGVLQIALPSQPLAKLPQLENLPNVLSSNEMMSDRI
ncbi:MAG: EamA family transporter [Chloroflexota bacterium]